MIRLRLALAVALVLLTATGCPWTKVKISPTAIEDFRSVTLLRPPKTITLEDSEISVLAKQANVSDDLIRDVAPRLDEEPVWKSSLTKLHEFIEAVPEDVRSAALSTACDFIENPDMTIDDIADALLEELTPTTQSEAEVIAQSFIDYYVDLSDALAAGDEKAAAVALSCYIVEQAAG